MDVPREYYAKWNDSKTNTIPVHLTILSKN